MLLKASADFVSLILSTVSLHCIRLPGNLAVFFSKYTQTLMTEYGFHHRLNRKQTENDLSNERNRHQRRFNVK